MTDQEKAKLSELLRASAAWAAAMSPAERKAMYEAQRKSWVVAELMMQHPEMTKEEAEILYKEALEKL
jgi:Lon protease-like protein